MNKNYITSIASVCMLSLFSFVNKSSAQGVVNFADVNFKAALVANRAINKNGDGEIQTSEAVAYKDIIYVSDKNISNLQGIEAFTGITRLYCSFNKLSSIDVSANTKLTGLRCDHNNITSLDVMANTALKELRCNVNSISSLNVSNNPQLNILWCFQNHLSELSTTSNTHLTELRCSANSLSTLDVSANHELTYLDCKHNNLMSLNVKNGNNTNFTFFGASQNLPLSCIQVDDPAYSSANWTDIDHNHANMFKTTCETPNTNIVYIPDRNLKRYLLANEFINTNHDSEIQMYEANAYDWYIDLSFRPARGAITDLTGLEAFSSIIGLYVFTQDIESLDVSHNTKLRDLRCNNTRISKLDVSANTELVTLHCFNMPLTTLDLSKNTKLTTLWCFGDKLTSLDVSASNKMTSLECHHNKLTSLILGDQPDLTYIHCYANKLTSLDVSQVGNLRVLKCNLNKITSLDLHANTDLYDIECHDNLLTELNVSANTKLAILTCTKNNLSTLDLSANTQLSNIQFQTNKLTFVNLKNGNNQNISYFNGIENPTLSCIQVDDPAYSRTNWTLVDPHTTFKRDCGYIDDTDSVVYIPDPNFKQAMLQRVDGSVDGVQDGEVQYREAATVEDVYVGGRNIYDLTGLEAFTNIKYFDCENNKITAITITSKYVELSCSGNQITSINGNAENLERLRAGQNKLTSLPALRDVRQLIISNNEFTSLAIDLDSLQEFDCADNKFTSLDLSHAPQLIVLEASNNKLTSLNVSGNSNLDYLGFSNNQLTTVNVSGNPNLTQLNCAYNPLASLDLQANAKLKNIYFESTPIASLDLSGNPALENLYVKSNQLTALDLSANTKLQMLNCNFNQIDSLDFSNHIELLNVEVEGNQLKTLNFSNCPVLEVLNVRNNQLAHLNMKNVNMYYFNSFAAQGNPDLTCIEVNDPAEAEAKWRDDVDPQTSFSQNCPGPNVVYIPDPNFKAAMLEYVDGSGDAYGVYDGEVQYDEAVNAYTVDVSGRNISDLTGLEAFTNLDAFVCDHNNITVIPAANYIQYLRCDHNQITTMNGDYRYLQTLKASNNKLTELPFTLRSVEHVDVSYNEITSINTNGLEYIQELYCDHNKLTSLITPIENYYNPYIIKCNNNELTSLDFSEHTTVNLDCSNNHLTSLNLKNGDSNNSILQATGNPDLTCIQVDDPAYSEANWRDNVDPGTSFSTNCSDPTTRLTSITVYPNPTVDKVFIKSTQPVDEVQVFDMINGGLKTIQHGNEIDFSSLHNGVYNMKIQQGNGTTSVRILKE